MKRKVKPDDNSYYLPEQYTVQLVPSLHRSTLSASFSSYHGLLTHQLYLECCSSVSVSYNSEHQSSSAMVSCSLQNI